MVRGSQSTTITFSADKYFADRGRNGTAQPITQRINPHSKPHVSYYHAKGVGSHHYGELHPMKPYRLTLTNSLVIAYGLDKRIHEMYDVRKATQEELEMYHDHDYIDFLSRVTPQNQSEMKEELERYNCVVDDPIFSDLYEFCRMFAGGSLAGARKLCAQTTDIAINWSGGLHHAKRGEASGFCYVNDIVLAILELLRYHPRVLYIDIDIHHGDGVELAFYQTDRVFTLSFHKYTGDFFPCTGKFEDTGSGPGKHFCLNIPLLDGIDDAMYLDLFESVVSNVINTYDPSAIVLQCGADSLGNDRLGAFNLSIKAHGQCVDFVSRYNKPLLVLGGGGYTIKNVSRCWTYETSVLVGTELPNELPRTIYDNFFADSGFKLHPPLSTSKIENQNSKVTMKKLKEAVVTKLRYLQGAPSVQMQEIPPNIQGLLDVEERNADEREEEDLGAGRAGDISEKGKGRMVKDTEFYDGDGDVDLEDGNLSAEEMPPPPTSSASASSTPKRGGSRGGRRGGRRGRGRGAVRARGVASPAAAASISAPAPVQNSMVVDT
ncbi:hypothetical protein DL96DRAFT_1639559 [Flagelloscypha sp. PMI_526]|nr:hypothetical protein DL96DRAFT_1639559 [Flagelloscypha sp. PMI_526]